MFCCTDELIKQANKYRSTMNPEKVCAINSCINWLLQLFRALTVEVELWYRAVAVCNVLSIIGRWRHCR